MNAYVSVAVVIAVVACCGAVLAKSAKVRALSLAAVIGVVRYYL